MSALQEAMELLRELQDRKEARSILDWKPYPTQWAAVNTLTPITALFGANQSGKTITGLRKMAWTVTGIYPEAFYGKRRTKPGFYWIVGESSDLTRDSLQKKLFGPDPHNPGKGGMIPANLIVGKPVIRQNSGGAYDLVRIRFIDGGISTIGFKNYSQGRENLQSATLDGLLVDEEPPLDCWTELLMRVSEAQAHGWGQVLFTFTPLQGSTKLVKTLMDDNEDVSLFFLTAEEAHHLGEAHIKKWTKLLRNDPAQLKARLYGLPDINSGLIWPVQWGDHRIPRFEIPADWPRLGGIDYGWNHKTVIILAAKDPSTDDVFVYYCKAWDHTPAYKIATTMRQFTNLGIQFYGDPSAEQPDKSSGKKLLHTYLDELLPGWENVPPEERPIVNAPRTPQVRIEMVQKRLDEGTLYFFDDLDEVFFDELQGYAWTKKGTLPEKDDDYPDGLGYLIQMIAKAKRTANLRRQWRVESPVFETPLRGY